MKKSLLFVLLALCLTLTIVLCSCKNNNEDDIDTSSDVVDTTDVVTTDEDTSDEDTTSTDTSEETETDVTTDNGEETTKESETTLPAVTHNVTFKADDKQVAVVSFEEGDESVEEPAVPAKTGYNGAWESYELGTEDITVNAVYTAIEYEATFMADGVQVGEVVKFTVESQSITEPEVPEKTGYDGAWEDYTLGAADITINATYTPKPTKYTVTFLVNGVEFAKVDYYEGDTELSEIPAIPQKPGFKSKWEAFELNNTNFEVNAIYTENDKTPFDELEEGEDDGVRTVTFIADIGEGEFVVKTAQFHVGDRISDIDIPEVPKKEGYVGKWEAFKVGDVNLVISAIYEKDSTTPFF